MKPLAPIFLLTCLTLAGFAQRRDTASIKPFGIKSCRIVYKFSDGPQSGTKTITFDNWGRSYKEEVTTITDTAAMRKSFSSIPIASQIQLVPLQHNLRIINNSVEYRIDLDRHLGQKRGQTNLSTWLNSPPNDQLTLVGTDMLLGKTCQVFEFQKAFRLWRWERITIKKQIVKMPGPKFVGEYATAIDEQYRIGPHEFDIPAGITFQ